ncbi:MAG: PQQ-binding-like beta-propeller repeat protein [Candidatus Cloacimonetes bacterium]|nr:PQQ-like beta-propeller repeat protein [Candidatus Cloacimonadota bacterium]NLO11416.1 PQQ-binding-like beta-propeller repeat protein [Candidatus Cloacimonadota bacterium]
MITLSSKMQSPPSAVLEYQVERDGRYGWFLAVWHPEEHHILEEIQAEIKLEIMNSDVMNISKIEAEKWLKNFFADYHWRLHASLRRSELKEQGISLFLGLMYDNEIYFVQFGRLFCVLGDKKKYASVGRNWENSHLQTLEQMNLLGMSAQEIRVRPQKVVIPENQFLLVLPGQMARDLFGNSFDPGSVNALLDSLATRPGALWLLLRHEPSQQRTKRRKFSSLHIATGILFLCTILAVIYVSFGGRFFEVAWQRARMLFQSKTKPIPLQEIPNYLNIENQRMRGMLEQALKSPARKVELKFAWNTDLPFQVTAAPGFDLENIYLATGNKVLAFNKKERNLLWSRDMESKVQGITCSSGGLMVNMENNQLLNLNHKGETNWQLPLQGHAPQHHSLKPIEISNGNNPRLDGSLLIIPNSRGIIALDINTGEAFSEITFKEDLQYLSAYDSFQSCFYAVVQNEIICIDLKILN